MYASDQDHVESVVMKKRDPVDVDVGLRSTRKSRLEKVTPCKTEKQIVKRAIKSQVSIFM